MTRYEWLTIILKWKKQNPDWECWIWPYAKTSLGYGRICVPGEKRPQLVHRVAYKIWYGHEPNGWACHKCSNRACFNVFSHVYDGTALDNAADKVVAGWMDTSNGMTVEQIKKMDEMIRQRHEGPYRYNQ